jgi:C1A family cysteine protease
MTAKKRKYSWHPDLPDHRDLGYEQRIKVARLPTSVDLTHYCSQVEDQGDLGSCTGNAIAGHLEFLEDEDGVPFKDISRLFIYYNERLMEGTVGQDAGARIRDGIKGLAKYGAAGEVVWPYDIKKFATKPPKAAYADGLTRKISSYYRIADGDLASMMDCLAQGFPFVFGFSVYEDFESAQVARTGLLRMPTSGERLLGGHAVLAVGYSQITRRVLVRNSWGPSWGRRGYFTMPFDYISSKNLANDFWTIRRGDNKLL